MILIHDFIVFPGSQAVHDRIEHCEYCHGDDGARHEQRHVHKVQHGQQFGDYLKGHDDMDDSRDKRKEEHGKHLASDGMPYLLLAHADFLHDLIALLVIISLGYLLIVDDQHSRHQEHDAQIDADEQKAAVQHIEPFPVQFPAFAE